MNEKLPQKKPIIIYYAIMLLIMLLMNAALVPYLSSRQVVEVGYDEFLDMLEAGSIDRAEIDREGGQLLFSVPPAGRRRPGRTAARRGREIRFPHPKTEFAAAEFPALVDLPAGADLRHGHADEPLAG